MRIFVFLKVKQKLILIRYDTIYERYDKITLRYIKPKVLQENEFPIKLIDKSTNKFLCNIDNFFNSDKKGT